MQAPPNTFWGKLDRAAGGSTRQWHPLFDHCADVGAVAEALLELPLWRQRLTRLAGRELDEAGWARLCVLAALHDLGKLNIGFQAKGRRDLGTTAGHVREGYAALFRDVFSALAELTAWGDGAEGLLIAAVCHHGRPYKGMEVGTAWQATWWRPRGGLDPRAGVADLLSRCRTWFPAAFETRGASLPDTPPFGHAFAGLVMLADWIGSDRGIFKFSEEGDPERMTLARPKARDAVAGMGLEIPATSRGDARGRSAFARVAPGAVSARPPQAAIQRLPRDERGSIAVLEAETGSGKTEAALAHFVALFEAGLVDGLYFALPTRSAASQMQARVHKAVQQAFAEPPPVILAVPGYLRVDEIEGSKTLPGFDVLWPEDRERFRYRAWAAEAPKRFLVGSIIVGTIAQVLLSSLMVNHAHLRATALLRHLLVVDEVHASDAYMTRILRHVLARHLTAGGHALLLSATLGAEARASLLNPERRVGPPSLGEAEHAPYPLLSLRTADVQSFGITRHGYEREVAATARPWLETPEPLAQAAIEAAGRGAKVLIVRNTVRDCVATQLAVEATAGEDGRELLFGYADKPAPHHSRFSRDDRKALDNALERRLGTERPDGGCVVVATQTVQQSLDLDADVLFTDLCPADVLLQRIGRLHRHQGRVRPAGFEGAQAHVIVPQSRDLGALLGERGVVRNYHGFGSVYPDLRALEATWRLLERNATWRIPAMNRHLVENGLHSDVLEGIAVDRGPRWRDHGVQMMGLVRGQSRQADLNLVDWSTPYCETSFPDAADQRIQTRLGEGDRRMAFAPPIRSPFGHLVEELVAPAWWVSGIAPDEDSAVNVVSSGAVARFTFGGRSFVYDRLGLRPDTAHPREEAEDDGP